MTRPWVSGAKRTTKALTREVIDSETHSVQRQLRKVLQPTKAPTAGEKKTPEKFRADETEQTSVCTVGAQRSATLPANVVTAEQARRPARKRNVSCAPTLGARPDGRVKIKKRTRVAMQTGFLPTASEKGPLTGDPS
jgi:hypothetical protein